jgi:hypothetical protein
MWGKPGVRPWLRRASFVLVFVLAFGGVRAAPAAAALTSMSATLDNPAPGATGVTHTIGYSGGSYSQCVRVHFGTSLTMSGTLPSGMSFTSPTLRANGVAWTTTTNTDYVQGVFGPGDTPNGANAVAISGVTNPSPAGTYYVRVELYSDSSCTSLTTGSTIPFGVTDQLSFAIDIPAVLSFSVSGTSSGTVCNGLPASTVTTSSGAFGLGHLGVSGRVIGVQQLQVSTNASWGYVVYANSMASANPVMLGGNGTYIADAAWAPIPAAGNEFFGLSTDSGAGLPSGYLETVPPSGIYATVGLAGAAGTNSNCVALAAGTSATSIAGTYSTTMQYTVVPIF